MTVCSHGCYNSIFRLKKNDTIVKLYFKSQYLNRLGLKVRKIRNVFFKSMFLPKNEKINSILLLGDLISFVFWKKVETPKRHFEINRPLTALRNLFIHLV